MSSDHSSICVSIQFFVLLVPVFLYVGLVCPQSTVAQDPSTADTSSISLRESLRENRYPIRLDDGELRGRGGKWLRERAKEATIVTLGESHGTQEIPAVMNALFEDLRAAGELDHLALEVSPWSAELMTDRLRRSDGAYNSLIETYPSAIPFYSLRPERNLVENVVRNSPHARPLWGLDQIFAFATTIALDTLKSLAPSPRARSAVERVRVAGQPHSAEDPELQNLPSSMPAPLTVYPSVAFDTLRTLFEGIPEAQTLIDELSTSTKIYRLNDTDNYESNQIRARYLRRNLQRNYQRALSAQEDVPQVAIKVGGWHAYRGRTPNNALDVGNLAVALAQQSGGTALNVAVVCGPGAKARDFPAGTTDCWHESTTPFRPVLTNGPTLFDLTALHPLLHQEKLDPDGRFDRLLWALDAIVLIPNAQPADPIASPVNR